jgi:dUTP pyrophosphatase
MVEKEVKDGLQHTGPGHEHGQDPPMMSVKVRRADGCADISFPGYMSSGAAGFDLPAAVASDVTIEPGASATIPTGLFVAIPPGYEGQVRPRSGLAANHGVTVLNSPGTVDSDYRGEVRVILINHGQERFVVRRGDRIAQMMIAPVTQVRLVEVEELPSTDRGEGGFGHTGLKS